MDDQSQESQPASRSLGDLSLHVLFKTVVKCFIWFGLAWLATSLMPGTVWPWYVAWAFVAIGLAFSLLSLTLAFISRRNELQARD
jgi:Zn-dependent protease with chaperone function